MLVEIEAQPLLAVMNIFLELFRNIFSVFTFEDQCILYMVVRSGYVFNWFLHHGTPTTDPGAYVQGMLAQAGNLIGRIYKLGARRIALVSLGPPCWVYSGKGPLARCTG
ncbi:hypothetical protein OIU85_024321 [Salix viminalis]|uniref:Uncharacterized protein n=1 Tax=Salix viminalis TaxID=40686 RepID=A0A9Q0U0K3_SALVM|nr:hypothetical protein OIU85_024321 [Salix viminalis]